MLQIQLFKLITLITRCVSVCVYACCNGSLLWHEDYVWVRVGNVTKAKQSLRVCALVFFSVCARACPCVSVCVRDLVGACRFRARG